MSKSYLLGTTSRHCVHLHRRNTARPKISKFTLFERADGKADIITRATIDSGEVERAGINVIDGDAIEALPVVVGDNEFKCEACGGVFKKGRSDSEALVEARKVFPGHNLGPDNGSVVCDDCYKPYLAERLDVMEPAGNA